MKNYLHSLKHLIIIFVIVSAALLGVSYAAVNSSIRELPQGLNFPSDKVLTIPFDVMLDPETVNPANVYVLDSNDKLFPVEIKLDSDRKTIVISPSQRYSYENTYTLYINQGVKYSNGKNIPDRLKMKFTIMNKEKAEEIALPVLGSKDKLLQLLNDNGMVYPERIYDMAAGSSKQAIVNYSAAPPAAANASANAGALGNDFSSTNIQVQGVDEGDIVKTDGQYIYTVSGSGIVVVKAVPPAQAQVMGKLDFTGKNFSPAELYIDSKYLVVLGNSYRRADYEYRSANTPDKAPLRYQEYFECSTAKALIYDISDRKNLKQLREVEIDGNYLSSRKIGSKLYIVTNRQLGRYYFNEKPEFILPSYKDSAAGKDFTVIGYDKIRYFPGCVSYNYLLTAGVDLENPQKAVKVNAYLGSGDNIYVSGDNMYISVTTPKKIVYPEMKKPEMERGVNASKPSLIAPPLYNQDTSIFKFSLNDGEISFMDKADIPGTVLNQFSMDEYNGFFRVAVTTGDNWWNGGSNSTNSLYIMDSRLNIAGKIEGIAAGEKIYSARFMGDRGYMVTYRKVDPLFVIDLKDPKNPKILGYLKIPGYSQYLHPYDENHIIGIGKDSIEVPDKYGAPGTTRAYYLGMKISIFDVTDVSNPKEMFVTNIGDRGTDSEVLWNHRALMFSREKGLLALPVNLYELKEGQGVMDDQNNYPNYGVPAFQGAYVYNIDLVNGITLKGCITHNDNPAPVRPEDYLYDRGSNIRRIIYINDNLYTISDGVIKINDIKTLEDRGRVILP